MMGFMRRIHLAVLFITIYLLWAILRWTVLPHLKIFPYIPPQAILVPAYNILAGAATAVFHWVLALLVFIYVLWYLINKYVPETILFFPVRSVILAIEPFPSLVKAGIIPYFDKLRRIIFSIMPFKQRLRSTWSATQEFFDTSIRHVLVSLRNEVHIAPPNISLSVSRSAAAAEAAKTPDQRMQDQEAEEIFQQCLEENTTPVDADASIGDRLYAATQNSSVRTICAIRRLQTLANVVSYRDP